MDTYINYLFFSTGLASVLILPVDAKNNHPTNQGQELLHILLITADDLNFSSTGFLGAKVPAITPNIDRLAEQGMVFEHAHVNCAVSQPSRAVLATGCYAHRNGVEGFYHTNKNIPTLMSVLRQHGYHVGIAGKVPHSTPIQSFVWDTAVDQPELGQGRDPHKYYQVFREFIQASKKSKKPFYFMLNSHDPHRPFHGSKEDTKMRQDGEVYPYPSRIYSPDEVDVPGFLPDIPAVREELSQYFSSVRRLDDTVGEVLKVLEDEGVRNNTLVMFLSDNGISAPFAKTNCYMNSTRTPWIVYWPKVVEPGTRNSEDFISGIDFMPTILEACGINIPTSIDGRSFLPLIKGQKQTDRNQVFTQFYETSARNRYPMFAVQDKKFGYIYNPWSDGKTQFKNDSQVGIAFKGMMEAGKTNTSIQQRVNMLWFRTPEEFYDLENDPNALNNLINDPVYKEEMNKYRQELLKWMKKYKASTYDLFRKWINYSNTRIQYIEKQ
ncbi:MAG: sulfatase [Tannerellaceae bacterium]|jgi:N-sulfoglucosamine sulfohydrolase|nr:sulfatase [Tannerellaceae bacterium]